MSNMTKNMLDAGIKNAGLDDIFEQVLSTDQIRTHKPDPRAYQMAIDRFKLKREEILFAAFAGWDVAGAKWFGYPTFWVNRLSVPAEELGVSPDAIGRDLTDLVDFVKARSLTRPPCAEQRDAPEPVFGFEPCQPTGTCDEGRKEVS
ncbi:MAG TPA: HAD-IA family hydrolase [Blastocatellia bacterium]|nr:HAD-IA family hydrolase [Blastocatellia bacterium]